MGGLQARLLHGSIPARRPGAATLPRRCGRRQYRQCRHPRRGSHARCRGRIPAAVDPIYAAIERHKQAGTVWDAAVDIRSNFNDLDMTDEQREQLDELDDAEQDAWLPCKQGAVGPDQYRADPPAGVVAAVAYIRIQMLDDGTYMPHHLILETGGDAKDTMGWIDAFLNTIANATTALVQVQP